MDSCIGNLFVPLTEARLQKKITKKGTKEGSDFPFSTTRGGGRAGGAGERDRGESGAFIDSRYFTKLRRFALTTARKTAPAELFAFFFCYATIFIRTRRRPAVRRCCVRRFAVVAAARTERTRTNSLRKKKTQRKDECDGEKMQR